MALLEPMPVSTPVVRDRTGFLTAPWAKWFELIVVPRIEQSAPTTERVALVGQSGAIALTPLVESAQEGVYRVTIFARVTQAATTSSSLQVAITATDGAVPYTQATAAQTGNTTTSVVADSITLRSDSAVPISYEVFYASVGATPMLYTLSLALEQIS